MSKMVWIVLLQLLLSTAQAQYKQYPKLQKLFEANKYDKCIKKAEKYAKEDSKEPIPNLYLMKCWLAIDEDDNHDKQKSAINKALSAGRKAIRKDKNDKLYDEFYDDFEQLKQRAFEKADQLVKDGKCGQAIRFYDNINELFGDRLSNYKKSLCMLTDTFQKADGFILLRNTVLGIYKDYKTGEEVTQIPQAFARLSKEYLKRNYYFNAEDILRKGVEVFPNDTAIRSELVAQVKGTYTATIISDYTKDLNKLRNHLLWADSCYPRYEEVQTMLKTTNYKMLTLSIQYDYDKPQVTLDFIKQCAAYDSTIYGSIAINNHLITLYSNTDIRRVDGALDNLTRVLIEYNSSNAKAANIPSAQYVFNFLLQQDNYEVAAYFIKQSKTLYPKDKKMLADMQIALENKLVQLLAAAPKELASLDLAEKFTTIAPANKKLPEIERTIYHDILKPMVQGQNFSLFFATVNRGLARFTGDPTMMKLKKEMVIKDFNQNFLTNQITSFGEMKVVYHVGTCTPGKVDSLANKKFIGLLNYLRRQTGMYDSCVLDAELNEIAQQAALMMTARNDLDHYPDSSWKCFTIKGKRGAGSSNLSLGHSGTDALLGQLEDDGDNNYSVGHRRWILNPHNKVFGHGSTDKSMALYVFGKYYNNPEKDRLPKWNKETFVSWPPKDYAPAPLVPRRWSFSLDEGDFSKAKISITLKGKPVKIKTEPQQQGYGLNTVVWRMENEIKAGDVYTIKITGVAAYGKTTTQNYTYTVEILDL